MGTAQVHCRALFGGEKHCPTKRRHCRQCFSMLGQCLCQCFQCPLFPEKCQTVLFSKHKGTALFFTKCSFSYSFIFFFLYSAQKGIKKRKKRGGV